MAKRKDIRHLWGGKKGATRRTAISEGAGVKELEGLGGQGGSVAENGERLDRHGRLLLVRGWTLRALPRASGQYLFSCELFLSSDVG